MHERPADHAPDDARAIAYLDQCVARLGRLLEPRRAELLSPELEAARLWTPQQLGELHRSLALRLAAQHAQRVAAADLPADIRDGFEAERVRIQSEIARKPIGHFTFANYRFKADMRILCLRRIPAGMYDLEVSAIPKRLLLGQGLIAGMRLARVIAMAGGFAPFFTQHVAPHRMKLFTPAQRERFLRTTAALLARRTDIRGLISTAWYNDPAMATVSPQLAYLGEGWKRWGQGIFRIGTSAEVTEGATAYSFERRRLVDSGSYVPTAYLGVALRRQLLALATQTE